MTTFQDRLHYFAAVSAALLCTCDLGIEQADNSSANQHHVEVRLVEAPATSVFLPPAHLWVISQQLEFRALATRYNSQTKELLQFIATQSGPSCTIVGFAANIDGEVFNEGKRHYMNVITIRDVRTLDSQQKAAVISAFPENAMPEARICAGPSRQNERR